MFITATPSCKETISYYDINIGPHCCNFGNAFNFIQVAPEEITDRSAAGRIILNRVIDTCVRHGSAGEVLVSCVIKVHN